MTIDRWKPSPESVIQSGLVSCQPGPSFAFRNSLCVWVVEGSQGDAALTALGDSGEIGILDLPWSGPGRFRVIRRTADYTIQSPRPVEFIVVEDH